VPEREFQTRGAMHAKLRRANDKELTKQTNVFDTYLKNYTLWCVTATTVHCSRGGSIKRSSTPLSTSLYVSPQDN